MLQVKDQLEVQMIVETLELADVFRQRLILGSDRSFIKQQRSCTRQHFPHSPNQPLADAEIDDSYIQRVATTIEEIFPQNDALDLDTQSTVLESLYP